MMWVWVFAGIAVAGLLMCVGYAIWLWHRASDLFSEVEMLGKRAEEAGDLLAQIKTVEDFRLSPATSTVNGRD